MKVIEEEAKSSPSKSEKEDIRSERSSKYSKNDPDSPKKYVHY